jgi:hypothetical protein
VRQDRRLEARQIVLRPPLPLSRGAHRAAFIERLSPRPFYSRFPTRVKKIPNAHSFINSRAAPRPAVNKTFPRAAE